jgi:hypothetical protein
MRSFGRLALLSAALVSPPWLSLVAAQTVVVVPETSTAIEPVKFTPVLNLDGPQDGALCYCDSESYTEQVEAFKHAWEKPPAIKGPGFLIRNETFHTLDLALKGSGEIPLPGSGGVKYYGMVGPGEVFYRSTGHWLFHIEAAININGRERYDDWDVVWPIVSEVALTLATTYIGGPSTWGQNAMAGAALTAGTASAQQGAKAIAWKFAKDVTTGTLTSVAEAVAKLAFSQENAYNLLEGVPSGGDDYLKPYRVVGGPGMPCVRRSDGKVLFEGFGPGATRPLLVVSPGMLPGDLALQYDPTSDVNEEMYSFRAYDKWSLGIDCNHSNISLDVTRTLNPIKAVFWSGSKKLSEGDFGPFRPDCGSFEDDSQFWAWSVRQKGVMKRGYSNEGWPPKEGEPVTRVDLIATGDDAFFIDELYLFRRNFEWNRPGAFTDHYQTETRGWWGRDDGKGYCLSTDPNDATYTTGAGDKTYENFMNLVDGCHRGISFEIDGFFGMKVHSLLPDPR